MGQSYIVQFFEAIKNACTPKWQPEWLSNRLSDNNRSDCMIIIHFHSYRRIQKLSFNVCLGIVILQILNAAVRIHAYQSLDEKTSRTKLKGKISTIFQTLGRNPGQDTCISKVLWSRSVYISIWSWLQYLATSIRSCRNLIQRSWGSKICIFFKCVNLS